MVEAWQHDTVTFTITLPIGGMFEDQIVALRNAKMEAIGRRDMAAAQALHAILALAERGALAFNTDVRPFQWPAPSAGEEK